MKKSVFKFATYCAMAVCATTLLLLPQVALTSSEAIELTAPAPRVKTTTFEPISDQIKIPAKFKSKNYYGARAKVHEFKTENLPVTPTASPKFQGLKKIVSRTRYSYLLERPDGVKVACTESVLALADGSSRNFVTSEYVANELIFYVKNATELDSIKQELTAKGMTQFKNITENGLCFKATIPETTLTSATIMKDTLSVQVNKKRYSTDYNAIRRTFENETNDPHFAKQWGLQSLRAKRAWNNRKSAKGVKIAVMDTGAKIRHEDLSLVDGKSFVTGKSSYDDDVGHGTHCAGIIGAKGNNKLGITGICQEVDIIPLKCGDPTGLADEWIIGGYDWCLNNNVKIVSCSFGGPVVSDAIQESIARLGANDCIVVCAAGNDGWNNDSPAQDEVDGRHNYPSDFDNDNIVSVASSNAADGRSLFSCFGDVSVDIAAPGEGILSTYNRSTQDYSFLDGTSMATPYVAGCLALIRAQTPSYTYLEAIDRLYRTGRRVAGFQISQNCIADVGSALTVIEEGGNDADQTLYFDTVVPLNTLITPADPLPIVSGVASNAADDYVTLGFNIPHPTRIDAMEISVQFFNRQNQIALGLTDATGNFYLLRPLGDAGDAGTYQLTFSSNSQTAATNTSTTGTFSLGAAGDLLGGILYGPISLIFVNTSFTEKTTIQSATLKINGIIIDEYDARDNEQAGATTLIPRLQPKAHAPHQIGGENDRLDWYRFDVSPSTLYHFTTSQKLTASFRAYDAADNIIAQNELKNETLDVTFDKLNTTSLSFVLEATATDGIASSQQYAITYDAISQGIIPTNILATDNQIQQVTVSWTGDLDRYYMVYRATENDATKAVSISGWIKEWSYVDVTAVPGTIYYYFVKSAGAPDGRGEVEGYSSSAQGFALPNVIPVVSRGTYLDKITVEWDTSCPNVQFRLLRSEKNTATNYQEIVPLGMESSYEDTEQTLTPGALYQYKVETQFVQQP